MLGALAVVSCRPGHRQVNSWGRCPRLSRWVWLRSAGHRGSTAVHPQQTLPVDQVAVLVSATPPAALRSRSLGAAHTAADTAAHTAALIRNPVSVRNRRIAFRVL